MIIIKVKVLQEGLIYCISSLTPMHMISDAFTSKCSIESFYMGVIVRMVYSCMAVDDTFTF